MLRIMVLFLGILGPTAAYAGFTTINQPWAPIGGGGTGELNLVGGNGVTSFGLGSQDSILHRLYSYSSLQQTYFGGLSISSVTRINDLSDQVWFNQNGHSTATAVYSGSGQQLGYYRLDNNSLTMWPGFGAGAGFVTGTASLATGPYQFLWHSDPSLFTASRSLQSYNTAGGDYFVSFRLRLSDGSSRYLVGIEDNNLSNSGYPTSDRDFNDFVFLFNGVNPIPAPGAALLGVLGLGIAGWVKRRMA